MAMYIRVKTTYFLQCDPTETVLELKQKLETLIDQSVNGQPLILLATGDVLNEDSNALADQKNDSVVALTLGKDDNEFEEINIVQQKEMLGAGENWVISTTSWGPISFVVSVPKIVSACH